jgi:hypothetical protein
MSNFFKSLISKLRSSPKLWVLWCGLVFVGLFYLLSMLIVPWFCALYVGEDLWTYVRKVWLDWQTFNAGMVAFLASLTVLSASLHHAEQQDKQSEEQRKRDFIAARAFLPEAFGDILVYCDKSMKFLVRHLSLSELGESNITENKLPELPSGYREAFRDCIKFADSDIVESLSHILLLLSIQCGKAEQMIPENLPRGSSTPRDDVETCLAYVVRIRVLINKISGYAKGLEKFDRTQPTDEDFDEVVVYWNGESIKELEDEKFVASIKKKYDHLFSCKKKYDRLPH